MWSADTSGTMSKITLYKLPDFKGDSIEVTADVADLSSRSFANAARSAKVVGQHWVAFKDVDFNDEFFVLGNGKHGTLNLLDREISSLRLVTETLTNPRIELFEDMNYEGKSAKIKKKTDEVRNVGFDKLVGSHKVEEGVWILYEEIEQAGPRLITFQKDGEWPNYTDHGWSGKLSSLRPLLVSDFEV